MDRGKALPWKVLMEGAEEVRERLLRMEKHIRDLPPDHPITARVFRALEKSENAVAEMLTIQLGRVPTDSELSAVFGLKGFGKVN